MKEEVLVDGKKVDVVLELDDEVIDNLTEDEINKLVKEYGNYVYDDYSEEKGKYDTYIEILQNSSMTYLLNSTIH